MALGEYKPYLNEIARSLRILVKNTCDGNAASTLDPTAATSATADPATIDAGYSTIVVTMTNGTGSVLITFPNGTTTYTLTAEGEVFVISGDLGTFEVEGVGGGEFKYYAY